MKKRSFFLLGLLLVVAAVSAGSYVIVTRQEESPPIPPIPLGPVDFIGEVVSVEFDPSWVLNPPTVAFAGGGRDSYVTVGPQTIALGNGASLYVPARTPGGNFCTELIPPPSKKYEDEFHSTTCVVMGQLTEQGEVAWFQVLQTTTNKGRELADVGWVTSIDTSDQVVMVETGFEFPLGTQEPDCVRGSLGLLARVDWSTGEVVSLECIYED